MGSLQINLCMRNLLRRMLQNGKLPYRFAISSSILPPVSGTIGNSLKTRVGD